MKYRRIIPFFFLVLLSINLFSLINVQSQETQTVYELNLIKELFLEGRDSFFYCNGTATQNTEITLSFYRNGDSTPLFTTQILSDNEGFWEYSRTFNNVPFGIYEIVCNFSDELLTTFFTYVKLSDWNLASFPLSTYHLGLVYNITSDRILRVYNINYPTNVLEISFPSLKRFTGLTQSFYVNPMCFRIQLQKGSVFNADILFVKSHQGLKILVEGSQDKIRTFTFKISGLLLKSLVNGVSKGGIVFDWNDIEKEGLSFYYDRQKQELEVIIEKNFSLDPVLFSDGFESGDFSAWDGTNGGVYVTNSAPLIYGSYYAVAPTTADFVMDDFSSQQYIWASAYFRVDSKENSKHVDIIDIWDTTGPDLNIIVTGIGWKNDGDGEAYFWYLNNTSNYWIDTDYDFQLDTLYYMEINLNLSTSDGVYDGSATLWINGSQVLQITNIDTDGERVERVRFGSCWDTYSTDPQVDFDNCTTSSDPIGFPEVIPDRNITFYFTETGKFLVNNSTITNGTSQIYSNGTDLELTALVNSSFGWYNFTYNNSTYTFNTYEDNPSKTVTIVEDGNITCYFFNATLLSTNGDTVIMTQFIPENAILVINVLIIALSLIGLRYGYIAISGVVLTILVVLGLVNNWGGVLDSTVMLPFSIATVVISFLMFLVGSAYRIRS